ncbi:MAG: VanZ family protein [Chloroflexota bacterium]
MGSTQNLRLAKQGVFFIYAIVIILLSLLPTEPEIKVVGWDKIGHFSAYLVMSLLGLLTFSSKNGRISILVVIISLGFILEWLQGFVPGRDTSLIDGLANSLGVLLGTALFFLFQNQFNALYRWFWAKFSSLVNNERTQK